MSALNRAHGVLLDLDGTLLDTAPDLIASINRLLDEQGFAALPEREFAGSVGHGSAPMIARAFNLGSADYLFEGLRQRFLDLYHEQVSHQTRPYDGMEAMIDHLEAAGIPWGIVTNKPGWLTEPLLTALGYGERPACVVTGDDITRRKPHPHQVTEGCRRLGLRPGHCVLVGDALRDIQAGQRAGTMTLAALYGYLCGDDQPERWGADGLIDHPGQILRWVALPEGHTAASAA
jgi:phosphoglycolate phosphatase